jgi:deoxyribonuclease-4
MKFGAHVSIAGSIELSIKRALTIGCDTFQIFTRNPRSWTAKELTEDVASKFRNSVLESDLWPIYAHMPYLPNIASPDTEMWYKSVLHLKEELVRCDTLKIPYIVTHLGSPKGSKKEKGISNIIKALNKVFKKYKGECVILLENTAGKDDSLGSSIEDICDIISKIKNQERIGFCLDTCHAFASGYDLRKSEIIAEILNGIDECIGLNQLLLIHCNDSKFDLGSGRDRHEHIGLGSIGEIGFKALLGDKRLRKVPFVCETPVDERRDDKGNLEYLRQLLKNI